MPRGRIIAIDEFALSFQQGEERGYDHYFRLYFRALHFFAFKILGNEADAEDVVQDCFARLWQRREEMKSPEYIRSFLYTAVRNACISYKRKRRLKVVQGEFNEDQLADEAPVDLERRVIDAEMFRDITAAAEKLPERIRQVFHLAYLGDKTDQEISELLNVSPLTVRNQRRRAIALIRYSVNFSFLAFLLFSIYSAL